MTDDGIIRRQFGAVDAGDWDLAQRGCVVGNVCGTKTVAYGGEDVPSAGVGILFQFLVDQGEGELEGEVADIGPGWFLADGGSGEEPDGREQQS